MKPETLLLRQVHPSFVQNGRVTSQVFRPTPKDEHMLSVDNGSQVSAEDSFARFIATPNCTSIGVQAVTKQDCDEHELPVEQDGQPYPEHCFIDYRAFSKKQIERKAKQLRVKAKARGWLYRV